MNFLTFENLLNELLSRKDELLDRTLRDESGKITKTTKDKPSAWYMQLIKAKFPDEPTFAAFGISIRHLLAKYVTTRLHLTRVEQQLKDLGPYMHSRESHHLSSLTKALLVGTELLPDELFEDAVRKTFKQTLKQKDAQAESVPDNLEKKLLSPILFDVSNVFSIMEHYQNTEDVGILGILLELALGTRSIDLMMPDIMTCKLHPTNHLMLCITGCSKARNEEQWVHSKQKTLEIQPLGLPAPDVLKMLDTYRSILKPVVDEYKADKTLRFLTELQQLHSVTTRVAHFMSKKLSNAAMKMFPTEYSFAMESKRTFSSHVFRALHANLSYYIHGENQVEEMFFKARLNHSGYGSILNYKGVGLKPLIIPGERVTRTKKPKKRKEAPVKQEKDLEIVTIVDSDGNPHVFTKFQTVMKLSDEASEARVRLGEQMLGSAGIKQTSANLKKLRLGQRAVNKYHISSKKIKI